MPGVMPGTFRQRRIKVKKGIEIHEPRDTMNPNGEA
jgi:hypothetical protein